RIYRVIAAANDLDPEIGHGPTGQNSTLDGLRHSRLDRRRVLARDITIGRAVLVDVAAAAVGRLHDEPDVAVLAARAPRARADTDGLVLALPAAGDGLAVRDLRVADPGVDAELAAQAVGDDVQVELAHAGDHDLPGVRIGLDPERRVLDGEPLERGEQARVVI